MITKWYELRIKILNWKNKRREDQLSNVNRVRERSINILQKRYGYSREKAIEELTTHYSGTWLG